jgi:hypothetical protein
MNDQRPQTIAREYMEGTRDNRVELRKPGERRGERIMESAGSGLALFRLWVTKGRPLKVYVDPLDGHKYYGSTVSVQPDDGGDGLALVWTVWEHEGDEYHSRPSDRECDSLGLPHGISTGEANGVKYDACLYDTHHESQYCYDVCYELAQLLRDQIK